MKEFVSSLMKGVGFSDEEIKKILSDNPKFHPTARYNSVFDSIDVLLEDGDGFGYRVAPVKNVSCVHFFLHPYEDRIIGFRLIDVPALLSYLQENGSCTLS